MKKIYWVSRHSPIRRQVDALKKIYGEDVRIIQDPNPFSNAEEIVKRYRESGCDDILVVAPLSVIQRLVELGVKPLWSEMQVTKPEEADVSVNGRHYKFVKFRRVVGVKIEFQDL
ncbi:MAG: hypothetical protein QXE50_05775 [Nitrososphaerota archaeon]